LTVDQVRLLALAKRWRCKVTAAEVLLTLHTSYSLTVEIDTDTAGLNSSPGAWSGPCGCASADLNVEVHALAGTEAVIITIIIRQSIKQSGDTIVIVHKLDVVQAIRGALSASEVSNQMNLDSSLRHGRTSALTTALSFDCDT